MKLHLIVIKKYFFSGFFIKFVNLLDHIQCMVTLYVEEYINIE